MHKLQMKVCKFELINEYSMRIHLKLSKNKEIIPYDYQQLLTSVVHKWIGKNNEQHNAISLYSFSWLNGGKAEKNGIQFRNGANWFVSSHDNELIKQIVAGIQKDRTLFHGLEVEEMMLQENPDFGLTHRFATASPIFIKRKEGERIRFIYHNEAEANTLLTETLAHKLQIAGLNHENVLVEFDKTYRNPTKKGTTYKGIKSIGSICPVIIKGTPEQIAFAWNVGLGNSTGIGFGALV